MPGLFESVGRAAGSLVNTISSGLFGAGNMIDIPRAGRAPRPEDVGLLISRAEFERRRRLNRQRRVGSRRSAGSEGTLISDRQLVNTPTATAGKLLIGR